MRSAAIAALFEVRSYELQPPVGPAFSSDVAEIFGVQDGKITSFEIYFDSAPFAK
jgi:ketosteroid isomerase-like protein